ncbi:MAG: hypothetical protein Q4D61_04915 [Cardiobacteriaceae bacterium]|nr:hypothetical protein [Cardiobacteriaceae bacterium]
MIDIALITFEHYADPARFTVVEEGIYQAVADQPELELEAEDYLLALSFAFENEEEKQDWPYFVEDLLERYNAFSPYAEIRDDGRLAVEFAMRNYLKEKLKDAEDDALPTIRAIKADLLGKRVYYTKVMENGQEYLQLTFE